jgi:hypothetical protein
MLAEGLNALGGALEFTAVINVVFGEIALVCDETSGTEGAGKDATG